MKLPRVRITVRGMMIAVALVVGLVIQAPRWWRISRERWDTAERCDRAAAYIRATDQRTRSGLGPGPNAQSGIPPGRPPRSLAPSIIMRLCGRKYQRPALLPFLPVAPDPPEPD